MKIEQTAYSEILEKIKQQKILFAIFTIVNLSAGIYMAYLWKKVDEETAKIQEISTPDITTLIKDDSNDAVDHLLQYGKRAGKKSQTLTALVGIKKIDSNYANDRLRELIAAQGDEQALAMLAFRMHGSQKDVETLTALRGELDANAARTLQEIIGLIKNRSKEQAQALIYGVMEADKE